MTDDHLLEATDVDVAVASPSVDGVEGGAVGEAAVVDVAVASRSAGTGDGVEAAAVDGATSVASLGDETVVVQRRRRIKPQRGGLWRDFSAEPQWIVDDLPTQGMVLGLVEPRPGRVAPNLPAAPPVVVPTPPPGGKWSVPPPGMENITRWKTQLTVPYAGPRRVQTFVQMFGRADQALRFFFVAAWLGTLYLFWSWWFDPSHVVTVLGLLLNSALLLYLSYLPVYFVLAAVRLRRVNPNMPVRDYRVAFVVTKAPSEPWPVVRTTIHGMLEQDYPHHYDVWICDEDPDEETYAWCERHGVGVSTRKGFPEYHQAQWPRRTKCKEGNLTFFYEHWGYDYYDVVVQLDADHVPRSGYLSEMVRPFTDPRIGYVAAPSVCDANAAGSWAARGRLYREANLHGALQVGSNGWLAPACFGSHYAVRTAALRDIGGIGPELAEDFSTTYLMCTAGWDGAFAIDAEAHGDGPDTFAAALTQEFQWSRSLMVVFMDIFPRHVRKLPLLLRARFLVALVYYPTLALTTVVGLALPPVACLTGTAWVSINLPRFLVLWSLASIVLMVMNAHLRRQRLFRPPDSKLVGWEMWLFALTRWPYVTLGVFAAVVQKIRPKPVTFKVTPKGDRGVEKLPIGLLRPYLAVALVAFSASAYGSLNDGPVGYVLLCLLSGSTYTVVIVVVSFLHAVEIRRAAQVRWLVAARTVVAPTTLAIGLFILGFGAALTAWVNYLDVLPGLFDYWIHDAR